MTDDHTTNVVLDEQKKSGKGTRFFDILFPPLVVHGVCVHSGLIGNPELVATGKR